MRFHQVHRTDGGRVRYKRFCELDGQEVGYNDIAKGYPLDNGETVILEPSDFDELPLPSAHTIEVLEFVPADQIDPIRYAKAYYLEPDKSAKPYVLLRDALRKSDLVAIVKVALRQREQLATLRVHEGALVLNTMRWPDEIRQPEFPALSEDVSLSKREVDMADSLIDSMTAEKFDDAEFSDDYREALKKLIDAKIEGKETVTTEEAEPTAEVIDLMSALQASVKKARGSGRGRSGTEKNAPPKKKSAGKKTAAKKSTAKKSTSSHRKAS